MFAESLTQCPDQMIQCIAYRKTGVSTSFELYEEGTNQFVVSCVFSPMMSPVMLFLKQRDCHLRRFEDICNTLNLRHYVGKLTADWMTKTNFILTSFEGNELCNIRLHQPVSTKPVGLSATLFNMDYDPDETENEEELEFREIKLTPQVKAPPPVLVENHFRPSKTKPLDSLFACFSDISCAGDHSNDLHIEDNTPKNLYKTMPTTSTLSNTLYTSITPIPYQERVISLETKKPTWNSELRQYTHFFGGRVKIPSYRNFVVMQVSGDSEHYQSAVEGPSDRICIRHGQVTSNSFILDFRSPVSPLIAFAIMCAVHA